MSTTHLLRIFRRHKSLLVSTFVLLVSSSLGQVAYAQSIGPQRERGRVMLRVIKEDIKENYFDPTFKGINLDVHFKAADEQIKQAITGDQIYGIIANTLLAFEDSHTLFIPPRWSLHVDYGWQMQIIGDKCYVMFVEQGSDAAAKGVKPGDLILSIFDFPPTRSSLPRIEYLFYRLRPLRAMRVVVQNQGAQPRQLDLATKVTEATERSIAEKDKDAEVQARQRYYEVGDSLLIWRMPDFDLPERDLDEMMKKVRLHKNLILDLRGNGGGKEAVLQRLVGYLFSRDVKIGENRSRRGSKFIVAKTRGRKAFNGQLIVLVDSRSASAAELFARVIQLEKRGTIIGDRTSGSVMVSWHIYHLYERFKNVMSEIVYGASITVAESIMEDGKSLEGVGVTPDEVLIPTSSDIADKGDPVLSRATDLVGIKLEPDKAGTLLWVQLLRT